MPAHETVRAQIAELDQIVSADGAFDLVGERIKRWKRRAVTALRNLELRSEADQFENLEPGSFQMGNPQGNRTSRVRLYHTHLLALAEDLELHPPALVGASHQEPQLEAELNAFVGLLQETESWFDRSRESKSYDSPGSSSRIDRIRSVGRGLLPALAKRLGRTVEVATRILDQALTGDIPNSDWRALRAAAEGHAASDTNVPSPVRSLGSGAGRDFFICHASEDKTEVARPVADALIAAGRTVWFDEFELVVGDSLRRKIDDGLAKSQAGVVILSGNFFSKDWPQRELDGLVALEKGVLPIWHRITREQVARFSPTLAGVYALNSALQPVQIAAELIRALTRGNSR